MDIENGHKTYELSFHVNPDLELPDTKREIQEILDFIEKNGGKILSHSGEPRRIRLSFPIGKKQAAYFVFLNLSADPAIIEKLNSQLKLHKEIIRFLITASPHGSKKLRILGERRFRPRAKAQEEKQETIVKPKEKAAESTEQLEQDIEKVIEQL